MKNQMRGVVEDRKRPNNRMKCGSKVTLMIKKEKK